MVSSYPKYSEGCVCLFTSWAFLPVTLSTCTGAVCCLLCVGSETMNDFHEAPNLDRYFLCSCGCYSQYTVNIGCGVQKSINVSAAQSWISRTLIFIIVDIYVKWNLWDHDRDAYALRPPPPHICKFPLSDMATETREMRLDQPCHTDYIQHMMGCWVVVCFVCRTEPSWTSAADGSKEKHVSVQEAMPAVSTTWRFLTSRV